MIYALCGTTASNVYTYSRDVDKISAVNGWYLEPIVWLVEIQADNYTVLRCSFVYTVTEVSIYKTYPEKEKIWKPTNSFLLFYPLINKIINKINVYIFV